jgi:hypothetical protein
MSDRPSLLAYLSMMPARCNTTRIARERSNPGHGLGILSSGARMERLQSKSRNHAFLRPKVAERRNGPQNLQIQHFPRKGELLTLL